MNKFGLLDEDDSQTTPGPTLANRLSAFPTVRPRHAVDLPAIDAAAAPHGFVSREIPVPSVPEQRGRRRRAIPSEPTRHLAVRLTESGYNRFVAYADRYQLTYHDAISRLLDTVGE